MNEKYGKYKVHPKFGNDNNGLEKFGNGGVADVYLAENIEEKDNKKMYVLKILQGDKILKEDHDAFNEEIKILKILSNDSENKYTPKIYDSQEYVFEDNNNKEIKIKSIEEVKPFFTIDFISNGCILYYVQSKLLFEKRTTKLLFKKIIEAVKFLHKKNIYHLDLKPDNIMLDKDLEPIIIDFGSSKKFIGTNKELNDQEKSKIRMGKSYTCPEMYKTGIIDAEKVDIFSLGVILFNLVTGGFGFSCSKNSGLYNLIKDKINNYTTFWKAIKYTNIKKNLKYNLDVSEEFKKLYVSMVAFIPSERPTIDQILDCNWLKEINDLTKEEKEKLEEDYREEFSKLLEKIRNEHKELELSEEIIKGGYITRAGKDGEYNLFKNKKLKPKKILNDGLHINLCIEINEDLNVLDFMNYLIIVICDYLNGDCIPSEDSLRLKLFFEEKEEIGSCTMVIELFEYEKGRYLIEFMRAGGEILYYYHYFLQLKKIISK